MDIKVDDPVKVSGKVFTPNKVVVDLVNEPGIVRKIQGSQVYVETQYGIHFIPKARVAKAD